MSDQVTVYTFDESLGHYGGIPQRDLTQADVDQLSLKLQAALDQDGSPYSKVTKKAQAEEQKKLNEAEKKGAEEAEKQAAADAEKGE